MSHIPSAHNTFHGDLGALYHLGPFIKEWTSAWIIKFKGIRRGGCQPISERRTNEDKLPLFLPIIPSAL
jgi:hypothetical protein